MCRLMPTLNNVYNSNFPIGYGYIRGNNSTVSRCSCDVSFMVNINANDFMSFVLQQAKTDDGTFGDDMLNTRLDVQ